VSNRSVSSGCWSVSVLVVDASDGSDVFLLVIDVGCVMSLVSRMVDVSESDSGRKLELVSDVV
jgi:hypothetical protein